MQVRRAADRRSGLDPLSVVAAVVLLAGVAQVLVGAVRVGVTWDEPTHVDRTQSLMDVGWFVPGFQLADGEPDEVSPFVYGPTYSMTAHAANVVAGNEEPGETAVTADAYAVRHLTTAVLGVLAMLAVGLMAWAITGSARIGLVGAAALAAIPSWTGHAMFNVKDVPAAAGYTLVTAGLVLALAPAAVGSAGAGSSAVGLGRRTRVAVIGVAVALGTFFGVGTRLAFWLPFAASIVTFGVLWVVQRPGRLGAGPAGLVAVGAGVVVGLAGIVAIYPKVFAEPLAFATDTVRGSTEYPWDSLTLTAGRLLHSLDLPWWYLPTWFSARMPVLLLVLAVGGLATASALVFRRAPGERWWAVPGPAAGGVLVAQQALMLPVAAIAVGSVMYDGFRQHLYVLPAVAVLVAVGADRVQRWATSARPEVGPWVRRASVAVLTVALLVPTLEQMLLFPYNYTYVNPVAGVGGVDGRWETDYWKASGREAVTRVPDDVELLCSGLLRPSLPDGPYFGPCQADVTTFEHLRGSGADTSRDTSVEADEGTWVIGYRREGNRPPAHCRSVDDVTRWVRGEDVVMAHVLVCDPDGF